MKEVKFYFYKMEYNIWENLNDFTLNDYFNGDLDVKTHLFDIGGHKAFLDKKKSNIYSFQKFDKDFNPIIKDENTGNTRNINLRETEYLIQESFIYLDFINNVAVFQYNASGYRVASFEKYIKQLLKEKFKDDLFVLKPILSKDGVEKLINHNIAKSIELSVASPNVGLLSSLGLDIHQIQNLDIDALSTIEIKLTSKRKQGLFKIPDLLRNINISDNKGKFKKLKIKASGSYTTTGDVIDLLDDMYVVTEKIKQKSKSRSIDTYDIIHKMQNIYTGNISKIREIIGA